MKIQHSELNGRSGFDYCRAAIAEGHPEDEVLEVWRGNILAYTISSLKWGASHKVVENSKRGPMIEKYKPMSEEKKISLKNKRKQVI